MVGQLTATRMDWPKDKLVVGNTLWFDNRPWTIVGEFAAPGTVMDAEIWCPLTDLQIAAKRDSLSCVILTLDTETTPPTTRPARIGSQPVGVDPNGVPGLEHLDGEERHHPVADVPADQTAGIDDAAVSGPNDASTSGEVVAGRQRS